MIANEARRRTRWWALAGALAFLALQPRAEASKNYQLFRLDTMFFFAYQHGPGAYGGGLYLEPKFTIIDPLSVGLHTGVAIFGGGSISEGAGVSMKVGAVIPVLAKAEYYILDSPIRPFVGFGMGMYYIASQSLGMTSVDQRVGAHFGMAPSVGIELGAFRLSFTYHAIIAAALEVHQQVNVGGPSSSFDVSQNYFTFDIGWRSWGKRKPAPPPVAAPPPPAYVPPPAPAPAPASPTP